MGFTITDRALTPRQVARAALRAQWDGLPSWIKNYYIYRFAFDSVNKMLDEGNATGAAELISGIEATPAILADATVYPELGDVTKAQFFAGVKAGFAAGIASLPT